MVSYKQMLCSKNFVNERHIKQMVSDESIFSILDPNLLMNERHRNVRKRIRNSNNQFNRKYSHLDCPDEFIQKELKNFKNNLTLKRPGRPRKIKINQKPVKLAIKRQRETALASYKSSCETSVENALSENRVESTRNIQIESDVRIFVRCSFVHPTETRSVENASNSCLAVRSFEIKREFETRQLPENEDQYAIDYCEPRDSEKDAIIQSLLDKNASKVILQKYFLRWAHFNLVRKLTKRNVDHSRLGKIEVFLRNISTERKKGLRELKDRVKVNDNREIVLADSSRKKLQEKLTHELNNKLTTQQNIIEWQKIKLQQQERLIAELKLSKLLGNTDESEDDIKSKLKFVVKNGCQKARIKAHCLQAMSNLKSNEEEDDSFVAKGLRAPKFLIEMQARALERELKHRQAKERREALEKDREHIRIAAEEAKRLEDHEEKRKRIDEIRRKRLEEERQKMMREQEKLKFIANNEKAKDFDVFRLKRFAFRRLRKYVVYLRENELLAAEKYKEKIKAKSLRKWSTYSMRIWTRKKSIADEFNTRRLQLMAFRGIYKNYFAEKSKYFLACDWYEMKVTQQTFGLWREFTSNSRIISEIKFKKAEIHYEWHLKWKAFDHWRRLGPILLIEKQTERRREEWRKKIYDLLPDYVPNRGNF